MFKRKYKKYDWIKQGDRWALLYEGRVVTDFDEIKEIVSTCPKCRRKATSFIINEQKRIRLQHFVRRDPLHPRPERHRWDLGPLNEFTLALAKSIRFEAQQRARFKAATAPEEHASKTEEPRVDVREHALCHDAVVSYIEWYRDEFWRWAKTHLEKQGWSSVLGYTPFFAKSEYTEDPSGLFPGFDLLLLFYRERGGQGNQYLVLPVAVEVKTGELALEREEQQLLKEVWQLITLSVAYKENLTAALRYHLKREDAQAVGAPSRGFIVVGWGKHARSTLDFLKSLRGKYLLLGKDWKITVSSTAPPESAKNRYVYVQNTLHAGYLPLEELLPTVKERVHAALEKLGGKLL
jgi:hypothetical protein